MRKCKTCTFCLDTFRKLQEFLEERTEERLNDKDSNLKTIEKLIALQDYMAKFAIVDCKNDSVEIELSQEDYEFLFIQLLIPAIFSYDRKHINDERRDLLKDYKELTDTVIARNDYLVRYSDYQSILIKNQKQLIEDLTNKLLEEETEQLFHRCRDKEDVTIQLSPLYLYID